MGRNKFLLRPKLDDNEELEDEWMNVHKKIYQGKYCADDLYELLVYLKDKINKKEARKITLLGNHDEENISDEMKELLDGILKKWMAHQYGISRGHGEQERS